MDAKQAFVRFVRLVLAPDRAERFARLAESKKGQEKVLGLFDHKFAPAILASSVQKKIPDESWDSPCYVFHAAHGFGAEFESMSAAHEELALQEGWLIILRDGSAGIHRPEGKWDQTKFLKG